MPAEPPPDDDLDWEDIAIPDPSDQPIPDDSDLSQDARTLLLLITEQGKGDGYWRSPKWLSRDDFFNLSGWPIERVWPAILELLKTKKIAAPMCGIYTLNSRSVQWGASVPLWFSPREIAKIYLERNAIPRVMSVARARFNCGLGPDPVDDNLMAVPAECASYRPGGCLLEPAPDWVFNLPYFGQVVAQAIRKDVEAGISCSTLQQQGRLLGLRVEMDGLDEIKAAVIAFRERGMEPYATFAQAALDVLESGDKSPSFISPRDFDPEAALADPSTAHVDEWWLIPDRRGTGELMLGANYLDHPTLGQGERLSHSSSLVWIDEEIGWARTVSRHYKLGKKLGK